MILFNVSQLWWLAVFKFNDKFWSIKKIHASRRVFFTETYYCTWKFNFFKLSFSSNFSTKVRLGDHTLSTEEDCYSENCAPRFQQLNIVRAIPHQSYIDSPGPKDDIAIIIMDQNASENGNIMTDSLNHKRLLSQVRRWLGITQLIKSSFTDFITPICLPFEHQPISTEEQLTVAGWGVINFGGNIDSPKYFLFFDKYFLIFHTNTDLLRS